MLLCRKSMTASTSASEELDKVKTTGTTHTLQGVWMRTFISKVSLQCVEDGKSVQDAPIPDT